MTVERFKPTNANAWALCYRPGKNSTRYRVRRVVWGRLLAREEKRDGEVIRPVVIYFRESKPRPRPPGSSNIPEPPEC